MQFNSYGFILFFLPISTFIYFMAAKIKPTLSKLVLIISSIAFFAIGRPEMLAFLAGSVTINYSAAVLIRKAGTKNKLHLTIPVIINAALLLYFKFLHYIILMRCLERILDLEISSCRLEYPFIHFSR